MNFQIAYKEIEIKNKIINYAKRKQEYFKNNSRDIYFLIVLKGSMNFFIDLYNELSLDIAYGFCKISTYDDISKKSTQDIKLLFTPSEIKNKDVIIIEDILDSGQTIKNLYKIIKNDYHAKSVSAITLIKRHLTHEHKEDISKIISVDFLFLLNNSRWVIGYGLDVNNKYRYFKDIKYFN